MKNVLFISPQPFFQWRGSPIRVGFNVLALSQLGYHVDLLTLPIGETRNVPGVNVIRVANPFRIKNIPIGPSLAKLFFNFLILFKGLRMIATKRYEVIHGIEDAGLIAVFLARLSGSKAIYEKHSDLCSHTGGSLKNFILRLYSQVEIGSIRWSDGVIVTGKGLARQVEKSHQHPQVYHIFDIPSSLEEPCLDATAHLKRQLHNIDDVLATYVGSFAPYQGLDMLFAAIPKVVQKCPQAKFAVIGGSVEEIRQKRTLTKQLGVDSHVLFPGKISPDQLPNYLAASDILLSPRSSGENTPLKLLDYLKVGRAIVATDIPANRHILDDESAMLVAPDADSFAQGIIALIRDKNHRLRLGTSGKGLCRNRYNFKEYSRRLETCYNQVTGKK